MTDKGKEPIVFCKKSHKGGESKFLFIKIR